MNYELWNRWNITVLWLVSSDVNKDWTHKDQDNDKDQSHKDKD